MNAAFSFHQLLSGLALVALIVICLVGCDRSSNTIVEQDELTKYLEEHPEAFEYEYGE